MEHSLKIISWNITKKCNLNCKHCYLPAIYKSGNTPEVTTSQELSTQEALHVIDQIASVNPEVLLILSGGEPLLRKDIFELTAYASEKGIMVVLGSNGIIINNKVAFKLKQKGGSGISISLDSTNPRIHDRIRSHNGAWECAVKTIRACCENGLSVQVNTVVTKDNYDEISKLVQFSQNLGVKVFSPFFLVCTGRGEEITDITPEQYEQILSFIVKSQGKYNGMMIRPRCAPTFRRILYKSNPQSPLLKMDTGRCMAGIHYCRITPEGDVTPCPYMTLSVGNVRNKSFKDIWENSKDFASLRNPSLKGKCKLCEFQLICGGCRARAFAIYKDHFEEDPWCIYIPKGGDIINPPAVNTDYSESNSSTLFKPFWTEEAEKRLKRVPFFVRSMVRGAVERYAIDNSYNEITPEIMQEAKNKLMMGEMAGH